MGGPRIINRFTPEQIEDMCERWKSGESATAIARDYEISPYAVRKLTTDAPRTKLPPSMPGERWVPIEGYEDLYLISNYARVYSFGEGRSPKILKQTQSKRGYSFVTLSDNSETYRYVVDYLVAKHFCENENNFAFVGHIDGNLANSHADNLVWVETANEGIAVDIFNARNPNAHSAHSRASREFTEQEIRAIKTRWLGGASITELAEEYNVPITCIRRLLGGVSRVIDPPCNPGEVWHAIDGYKDMYYVSNQGRVFTNGGGRNVPRIMRGGTNRLGYKTVCLRKEDGGFRTVFVHRLVATYFVDGHDETNDVVNHIDGNPGNNYADNLEWCTQKYNIQHAMHVLGKKLGPHGPVGPMSEEQKAHLSEVLTGRRGTTARFADEEIRAIRNDPRSASQVAKEFGVNKSTITSIRRGTTYRYVE